ncbi:MAG: AraC family transcriptional regulator [Oscillospiraceae bacterium]|nr:AraC family transcriptional regulator [Oscillospiraceae bacterium]
MNWSENINEAIDYIENNLTEKIDYNKAARISCCSLNKFQRLFLFVTDINVSEYVRRRRMTLAAEELMKSDIKIIDLALKYSYESPEAFTRAYQSFHGYPPSVTRKFGVYNKYGRLSIQIKIHGGDLSMKTEQNKEKKVIKGVCEIGWGFSANPYAGVITACMEALGEGRDCELAGVISGLGFAYTWYPGAPNDAIITDDNMIKRTFDALGYKVSIYRDSDTHNTAQSRTKEFYKNQIISSIDRGFPVLGFGFTNSYPFACAILGYENGADTLYLRSYWDDNVTIDEETGYQRTSEWYDCCYGIVVIEEKITPAIKGKELLRHCLKAAVEISEQKTTQFYDITVPYGLASYDTMIGVLEDDGFWEAGVFSDAYADDRQNDFYGEMDRSYTCVGLLLSGFYKNCFAAPWLKKHTDASEAGNLIREGCEYYSMLDWLITQMIRYKPEFHDCKFVDNPSELVKREVREYKIPFIKIVKQLDKTAVECFKRALELL